MSEQPLKVWFFDHGTEMEWYIAASENEARAFCLDENEWNPEDLDDCKVSLVPDDQHITITDDLPPRERETLTAAQWVRRLAKHGKPLLLCTTMI